mmetsp:Transcript_33387/g.73005  ORF Transcript_33387/g.73005 Transcript_33387/m.73005 type:complete len:220 (+) Transcript_33387:650-1309(+)
MKQNPSRSTLNVQRSVCEILEAFHCCHEASLGVRQDERWADRRWIAPLRLLVGKGSGCGWQRGRQAHSARALRIALLRRHAWRLPRVGREGRLLQRRCRTPSRAWRLACRYGLPLRFGQVLVQRVALIAWQYEESNAQAHKQEDEDEDHCCHVPLLRRRFGEEPRRDCQCWQWRRGALGQLPGEVRRLRVQLPRTLEGLLGGVVHNGHCVPIYQPRPDD